MKWIEYFLEFASPQLTWQISVWGANSERLAACPSLRHQIEYQSRFDFPGRLLQASGHGDVVGGWSGGSGRTPCSLMVGASASVHMRRTWRLLGNQANAKVRLSNAIWMNMAPMLQDLQGWWWWELWLIWFYLCSCSLESVIFSWFFIL